MTANIVATLALSGLVLQAGAACSEEQMSYGETEYLYSCAPCHGLQGKGDGALAGVLKKGPRTSLSWRKRTVANSPTIRFLR